MLDQKIESVTKPFFFKYDVDGNGKLDATELTM